MPRLRYAIAGAVLIAAGLGVAAHAQQLAAPPFATAVTSAGVIATDPIGYGT